MNPRNRVAPSESSREFLRALFAAALAAADPYRAIAPAMPAAVAGRTVVVGAGKASAAMARGFSQVLGRDFAFEGVLVAPHESLAEVRGFRSMGASHPVPDSGSMVTGHLLRSSLHGSRWLTGGSVGPEGSLLFFAVIALTWMAFDRMYPEVKYQT